MRKMKMPAYSSRECKQRGLKLSKPLLTGKSTNDRLPLKKPLFQYSRAFYQPASKIISQGRFTETERKHIDFHILNFTRPEGGGYIVIR
jgi:hypothetical protein